MKILKKVNYLIARYYIVIEIIIIFTFSLTPLLWFNGDYLVTGHDSGFRYDNIAYFQQLKYPWQESVNFGQDWSIFRGFITIQYPELFFSKITGSLQSAQPLVFIFWFFTMSLGMYLFLTFLFKSRKYAFLRIIGTIFYVYNFFILQGWFIAERAKFSLYALLPISLLLIANAVTERWNVFVSACIFGMLYGLFNGGSSPPLYGASIILWTFTFIYFGIQKIKRDKFKGLISLLLTIILFGSIFIACNSYWIISHYDLLTNNFSSAVSQEGGIDGLIAWEKVINQNTSIINLLRMQGIPDWYTNYHPFSSSYLNNNVLLFFSLLPIFLILLGLIIRVWKYYDIHQRHLIFLLYLILPIGIFFASGSHKPFGFIYILFMKYIPGFAIFRSSFYKFAPLLYLSLTLIIVLVVNVLVQKIQRKWIKYFVYLIVVVIWLGYHKPFFTPKFFDFNKQFSTRLTIPKYVYKVSDLLNQQVPAEGRILLLPPPDTESIGESLDLSDWGYYSLTFLPRLTTTKRILTSDDPGGQIAQILARTIIFGSVDQFIQIAKKYSVTHVLFRKDVITNEIVKDYETALNNKLGIPEISEGKWVVYKIQEIIPNDIEITNSERVVSGAVENDSVVSSFYKEAVVKDIDTNNNINLQGVSVVSECFLCKPQEFSSMYESFILPTQKSFFSDLRNKLFPPVKLNNNEILISTEKIDYELSNLLWLAVNINTTDSNINIIDGIVDKIIFNFNQLSQRQKIIYANKISLYTNFLINKTKLPINIPSLKITSNISPYIWYGNESEFKYGVMIPESGNYSISIPLYESRLIQLNNKKYKDNLYLNAGYYQFTLPRLENEKDIPIVLFNKNNSTNQKNSSINYLKVSPTEYKIEVNNDHTTLIILKQLFDERWKLIGVDNKHIKVNSFLNGWYIKPGVHVLTIKYDMQDKYDSGTKITFISYLLGFCILIYYAQRKLKHYK